MEKTIIYSVIIPVYNTNVNFLKRCIDSLANQTIKDCFEVILINDGSTDYETLTFIHSIRLPFLKVYSTNNLGVSHARNYGILHSSSPYIIFLDSDDFLKKNFFEVLINFAKEEFDLIYIYNDFCVDKGLLKKKPENNVGVIWAKVFKKSIIVENNIYFNEDLKYCEDTIFLYKYSQFCQTKYLVKTALYTYFINSFSAGHSYSPNCYIDFNNSLLELSKIIVEKEIKKLTVIFFIDFVLPKAFYNSTILSNKQKKEKAIAVLNDKNLLFYSILSNRIKDLSFFRRIQLLLLRHYFFRYVIFLTKLRSYVLYHYR